MKLDRKSSFFQVSAILTFLSGILISHPAFARFGGAGGHGYSGGHGGGGYGGGGYGGGGYGFGGGSPTIIILVIIVVVIYMVYSKRGNNDGAASGPVDNSSEPFPAGLDQQKVANSFMSLQNAWMQKDPKNIRKWISDGMYQRLTTQFKMMDILGQKNELSNIRINGIASAGTQTDGQYHTAEIAISFSMNDSFVSAKYPEFNESYPFDTDTEYWTFIKRSDSVGEKNLYDNNNCPNCGAPFEVKIGEIARCSNCNTLTNSAAYDWVLSEVTQQAEYSGGAGLSGDAALKELMKNDPFFSVQRMEDIASNIFMQIMSVLTGNDKKRLTRFADEATTTMISEQLQHIKPFVFDRLFLNEVTLTAYNVTDGVVKLDFDLAATYRRVSVAGKLQMLDNDFVTRPFNIELSRSKDVLHKTTAGETVYSYECSSCGAPYTDTTQDHCEYCDAPVIDINRNWVLTGFAWR